MNNGNNNETPSVLANTLYRQEVPLIQYRTTYHQQQHHHHHNQAFQANTISDSQNTGITRAEADANSAFDRLINKLYLPWGVLIGIEILSLLFTVFVFGILVRQEH